MLESLVVSAVAATFFIAWGLWVNWEHGLGSRIQVALTQAGISFLATFLSSELLRWIARLVRPGCVAWPLTSTLGWVLINALVFVAHFVFGTPEIIRTMIPGMLTGVFFCASYGYRLTRPKFDR